VSALSVRPWTVKQGKPWVQRVHRHLPSINGAKWCVRAQRGGEVVGAALVGPAARLLGQDTLEVLRVAVLADQPHVCSLLYGACSRAARAMGAENLVTYTLLDEPGTSLKAAGWKYGGVTDGGEWNRPSRPRAKVRDSRPKHRWWAPWSYRASDRFRRQCVDAGIGDPFEGQVMP
jgi:hypothetical protein